MKLFLRLSFLGTEYCGYQVQDNAPSVQQLLNEAAEKVFGFPCDIVGCSRTDSGVHAEAFTVSIAKKNTAGLETSIPIEKIPIAMNCFLPKDISIYKAMWVSESFHARYDVKYKEYVYRIWNGKTRNPFFADRMFYLPNSVDDMAVMRANEAAKAFVGTHDFCSFMASGSKVADTIRTVYDAFIVKDGEVLSFYVSANGFLYNMVRIMAGTLIDVLLGKKSSCEIKEIIEKCDRRYAGSTVPACGLYLHKVSYENYQEGDRG